jgi:hypothetical protein
MKGKKLKEYLLFSLMVSSLVGIAILAFIAVKDGYRV